MSHSKIFVQMHEFFFLKYIFKVDSLVTKVRCLLKTFEAWCHIALQQGCENKCSEHFTTIPPKLNILASLKKKKICASLINGKNTVFLFFAFSVILFKGLFADLCLVFHACLSGPSTKNVAMVDLAWCFLILLFLWKSWLLLTRWTTPMCTLPSWMDKEKEVIMDLIPDMAKRYSEDTWWRRQMRW